MNGESNVLHSQSNVIWGDKSLWTSPISNTANGSVCSQISNSKESVWHSTQSSPISSHSSSHFLNQSSVWDPAPKLNINASVAPDNESLGAIWMIPQTSQSAGTKLPGNQTWEAPLAPPITYSSEKQHQLLRPQDIGGNAWGNNNNNNSNNHSANNATNGNAIVGKKDPVGSLWAHPTPPSLPGTLQAQNYNLLTTNHKFQPQQMGNSGNLMSCGQGGNMMSSMLEPFGDNSMQLFSDEFMSYLNLIN